MPPGIGRRRQTRPGTSSRAVGRDDPRRTTVPAMPLACHGGAAQVKDVLPLRRPQDVGPARVAELEADHHLVAVSG